MWADQVDSGRMYHCFDQWLTQLTPVKAKGTEGCIRPQLRHSSGVIDNLFSRAWQGA
jgi:hypothetical protein